LSNYYTKPEVDAKIAAIPTGGGGSSGMTGNWVFKGVMPSYTYQGYRTGYKIALKSTYGPGIYRIDGQFLFPNITSFGSSLPGSVIVVVGDGSGAVDDIYGCAVAPAFDGSTTGVPNLFYFTTDIFNLYSGVAPFNIYKLT
jgi:hypothetical protein